LPERLTTPEAITDWDSRIASYDQERQDWMKLAQSKMSQYEEFMNADDWKDMINDRKQGVLIQTRISPTGGNSVKATGILVFPIDLIFSTIGDSKYRTEYDSNYDVGHYIRKIGTQSLLIYQKTKKVSIVSPRDFVMVLIYNRVIQFI
jgi:hypothetical protein